MDIEQVREARREMEGKSTEMLAVGEYDPHTDTIVIEGTRYSGALFRDGLGINSMIGQVIRIDRHENGVVTVTRLRHLENLSDE